MKYHPICELNNIEKSIVIEEIGKCVFAEFTEGDQLNLGQIIAAMVKTVDLVLMRQLK